MDLQGSLDVFYSSMGDIANKHQQQHGGWLSINASKSQLLGPLYPLPLYLQPIYLLEQHFTNRRRPILKNPISLFDQPLHSPSRYLVVGAGCEVIKANPIIINLAA